MRTKDIICPFCRAANPPTGYVCIKCFRVMSEKYKIPFWKMQISTFGGVMILSAVALTFLVFFISEWLSSVEGELDLKVRTQEYSVSLAAEKTNKDLNVVVSTGPSSGRSSSPKK